MDFDTTTSEKRDSQVEEVSEFFNTGFSLGKRKSNSEMETSTFKPITMPYSKCRRQRLGTILPTKPRQPYGQDANHRLEISCSPLQPHLEFQMEVQSNESQQRQFHHRVSPVTSAVRSTGDQPSISTHMDVDERTATLHRIPKLQQRETNVVCHNHSRGPHNTVIYHHQNIARRRRREKVSLFSKPWAAYPSLEDRQKEERKVIKDGFKKRRMLM